VGHHIIELLSEHGTSNSHAGQVYDLLSMWWHFAALVLTFRLFVWGLEHGKTFTSTDRKRIIRLGVSSNMIGGDVLGMFLVSMSISCITPRYSVSGPSNDPKQYSHRLGSHLSDLNQIVQTAWVLTAWYLTAWVLDLDLIDTTAPMLLKSIATRMCPFFISWASSGRFLPYRTLGPARFHSHVRPLAWHSVFQTVKLFCCQSYWGFKRPLRQECSDIINAETLV